MKEQVFLVDITGYWMEAQYNSMLTLAGIFFVVEGSIDPSGNISVHRILHIAMGDNLRQAIRSHPDQTIWRTNLMQGMHLFFAAGIMENYYRPLILQALIQFLKPVIPGNTNPELLQRPVRIINTGNILLTPPSFTVYPANTDYNITKHRLHLFRKA